MQKKCLIITHDLMCALSTRYNIKPRSDTGGWIYTSPNHMIIKTIDSEQSIVVYGTFSRLSLPTNDIEQYPKIAEDIQDFYTFQKEFQLETVDEAVSRRVNTQENP